MSQRSFSEIAGRALVIEEKIDGANTAISFDTVGRVLLQYNGPRVKTSNEDLMVNVWL
jgi:hypothetical protein